MRELRTRLPGGARRELQDADRRTGAHLDGKIVFRGLIAMPDGSLKYETEASGEIADAVEIGRKAGEELKARAGEKFFQMMVEMSPQQVLGQITK